VVLAVVMAASHSRDQVASDISLKSLLALQLHCYGSKAAKLQHDMDTTQSHVAAVIAAAVMIVTSIAVHAAHHHCWP
jgi:hypothetical protein